MAMTITFPEDISMRFGLVRLDSGGPSSPQLGVSALDLALSFPLLRPLSTLNACARPGIVLPLESVSHPLRKYWGIWGSCGWSGQGASCCWFFSYKVLVFYGCGDELLGSPCQLVRQNIFGKTRASVVITKRVILVLWILLRHLGNDPANVTLYKISSFTFLVPWWIS